MNSLPKGIDLLTFLYNIKKSNLSIYRPLQCVLVSLMLTASVATAHRESGYTPNETDLHHADRWVGVDFRYYLINYSLVIRIEKN